MLLVIQEDKVFTSESPDKDNVNEVIMMDVNNGISNCPEVKINLVTSDC